MATTSTVDDRTDSTSVLVVDGDPVEARFVAESLELADPAVSTSRATTPEDALAAIENGGIDCIVTHDGFGDADGLEFLDDVAQVDPSVRAIVHTAADDPALAREAWDRGAAYARTDVDADHHDVLAAHITARSERE